MTMTPLSPNGGVRFDGAMVMEASATFSVVHKDDSVAADGIGMN